SLSEGTSAGTPFGKPVMSDPNSSSGRSNCQFRKESSPILSNSKSRSAVSTRVLAAVDRRAGVPSSEPSGEGAPLSFLNAAQRATPPSPRSKEAAGNVPGTPLLGRRAGPECATGKAKWSSVVAGRLKAGTPRGALLGARAPPTMLPETTACPAKLTVDTCRPQAPVVSLSGTLRSAVVRVRLTAPVLSVAYMTEVLSVLWP